MTQANSALLLKMAEGYCLRLFTTLYVCLSDGSCNNHNCRVSGQAILIVCALSVADYNAADDRFTHVTINHR